MFVHYGRGIRTCTDEGMSPSIAMYVVSTYWATETSPEGKYDVHCNARQRRRIRMGSNPTSVMNKHMNYISGMAEKTTVATITEGNA